MFTLLQALPDFDPSIAEEFGYQVTQGPMFLGVPLLEAQSLMNLLLRFAFNLLVSWVLVHFFYFRKNGRREYCLTFMAFSSAMFLLIFLMGSVNVQIGLTLGLFAIFGVIRYRTETVPVREMTYLFVIITVAVINGLALNVSYAELLLANVMLLALIGALEGWSAHRTLDNITVTYDRIELITPERSAEMKADLEHRLGREVDHFRILKVNMLKDSASVTVYFKRAGSAEDE